MFTAEPRYIPENPSARYVFLKQSNIEAYIRSPFGPIYKKKALSENIKQDAAQVNFWVVPHSNNTNFLPVDFVILFWQDPEEIRKLHQWSLQFHR